MTGRDHDDGIFDGNEFFKRVLIATLWGFLAVGFLAFADWRDWSFWTRVLVGVPLAAAVGATAALAGKRRQARTS